MARDTRQPSEGAPEEQPETPKTLFGNASFFFKQCFSGSVTEDEGAQELRRRAMEVDQAKAASFAYAPPLEIQDTLRLLKKQEQKVKPVMSTRAKAKEASRPASSRNRGASVLTDEMSVDEDPKFLRKMEEKQKAKEEQNLAAAQERLSKLQNMRRQRMQDPGKFAHSGGKLASIGSRIKRTSKKQSFFKHSITFSANLNPNRTLPWACKTKKDYQLEHQAAKGKTSELEDLVLGGTKPREMIWATFDHEDTKGRTLFYEPPMVSKSMKVNRERLLAQQEKSGQPLDMHSRLTPHTGRSWRFLVAMADGSRYQDIQEHVLNPIGENEPSQAGASFLSPRPAPIPTVMPLPDHREDLSGGTQRVHDHWSQMQPLTSQVVSPSMGMKGRQASVTKKPLVDKDVFQDALQSHSAQAPESSLATSVDEYEEDEDSVNYDGFDENDVFADDDDQGAYIDAEDFEDHDEVQRQRSSHTSY
ncbi:hypothetical protein CYMTET_56715 [Cymbomonas tetramitiformis]|uniref:Uncharacterized protein n=1 Tax=Cymbomonas tetramitiformis TaxID=36881 RepID=A0AAE0ELJ6_9CHLO|nr:hypothetical protein CYMTET_56715 [Cymbomonas tetramitiformis]